MLARYQRLLDRIGTLEQGLGIGLILLIVTAITVQVFTRYVLGRPIAWVEESATYAFIWMVFVGASLGLKRSRHIVIATFGSRLPPRLGAALRVLVWLLVLGTLVVLVVQGNKIMGIEGRSKTISLPDFRCAIGPDCRFGDGVRHRDPLARIRAHRDGGQYAEGGLVHVAFTSDGFKESLEVLRSVRTERRTHPHLGADAIRRSTQGRSSSMSAAAERFIACATWPANGRFKCGSRRLTPDASAPGTSTRTGDGSG